MFICYTYKKNVLENAFFNTYHTEDVFYLWLAPRWMPLLINNKGIQFFKYCPLIYVRTGTMLVLMRIWSSKTFACNRFSALAHFEYLSFIACYKCTHMHTHKYMHIISVYVPAYENSTWPLRAFCYISFPFSCFLLFSWNLKPSIAVCTDCICSTFINSIVIRFEKNSSK